MIEATYLAACGKCLILVVFPYDKDHHAIGGEELTRSELRDLIHCQQVMIDMVEREGIPVFDNFDRALACARFLIEKQKELDPSGFIPSEEFGISSPIRMSHVTLGDKLVQVRQAFNALDIYNVGKLSMEDVRTISLQLLYFSEIQGTCGFYFSFRKNGSKLWNHLILNINSFPVQKRFDFQ
jgi:hypothetical protein